MLDSGILAVKLIYAFTVLQCSAQLENCLHEMKKNPMAERGAAIPYPNSGP